MSADDFPGRVILDVRRAGIPVGYDAARVEHVDGVVDLAFDQHAKPPFPLEQGVLRGSVVLVTMANPTIEPSSPWMALRTASAQNLLPPFWRLQPSVWKRPCWLAAARAFCGRPSLQSSSVKKGK
ncbi:MAG TPA: hypothetical protein VLJ17_10350 [Xanthobacteraceae bacterium]|nr:hypothetical protein [Xanthobacteraceae bacterium]